MSQFQPSSPTPRPALSLPNPAGLKLRIPRVFRPGADQRLDALLKGLDGLPPQTALLGLCDDDLPVLLDLTDPAPGALMVACDDREQRMALLRTLVHTATALNTPRNIQFLVLSSQPQEWQRWIDGLPAARHCLAIAGLEENTCERWLLKLSNWADQRRTASIDGPAVLLIVDDLSAAANLSYDARVSFDWLAKEGPNVKIWPVAAAAAESLPGLERWVRLFKSRILGYTVDPEVYRQALQLEDEELAMFGQPGQFAVRIQENWLKFHAPA